MVTLVQTPTVHAFDELVSSAREHLTICSPYIGREPCDRLNRLLRPEVVLTVLCDLRLETVLSGATQPGALASLFSRNSRVNIHFVPAVHAKVFVSDSADALVTSANMTYSGMHTNFEYGVRLRDEGLVSAIRADVECQIPLGTAVSSSDLEWMETTRKEFGGMARYRQDDLGRRILDAMTAGIAEAHKQYLQLRAAGRSPHAIFRDAIIHCLVRGPLTTQELHTRIQSIHPDFCDDTVDRVINGQHFGKKWKHAVRTAQQSLKKEDKIRLDGESWYLVEKPTRPRYV